MVFLFGLLGRSAPEVSGQIELDNGAAKVQTETKRFDAPLTRSAADKSYAVVGQR